MRSKDYWAKRTEQIAKSQHQKTDRFNAELKREYEKAIKNIQKELDSFYRRFANANGIVDMAEARRILTAGEMQEFKYTLEEFIALAKDNVDGRWTAQLNNVYRKVRITRLDAIQIQLRQQVEMLTAGADVGVQKLLSEVYQDTYYRTIFEIQKGTGIGVSFAKPDATRVLNKEWIGANYSKRIWTNRDMLASELQTRLSQSFIRGDSIDRTSKELADRMEVSFSKAARIVRTESSFIANEATWDGYKASGVVDKYEFLATLDSRTSSICQSFDGQVFKLSEKEVGVNFPPLHANCRSTVVPYFEDELEPGQRIARNEEGKSFFVPSDMTYKEWYNQYVKSLKLPKKLRVDDSKLPVQLSFRGDNGKISFIPRNTQIADVHIIAGKGVSVEHRASERLAQEFGGAASDWVKKVGKIESDKYVFDIHWVENIEIGGKEYKISGKKVKQ